MSVIEFKISKRDSKLDGAYRCSAATMACRNANDVGQIIAGTVSARVLSDMRVVLPDGSNCVFNGEVLAQGRILSGNYVCQAAGEIVEDGTWEARRQF
jgi:hypothetical protein